MHDGPCLHRCFILNNGWRLGAVISRSQPSFSRHLALKHWGRTCSGAAIMERMGSLTYCLLRPFKHTIDTRHVPMR